MKKTIFTLLTTGITLFSVSNLNAQVTNYGSGSGSGGNQNTNVGYRAGELTSTGTNNSFFGHLSGRTITTGSFNSFFGSEAGSSNSATADANTFVGYQTGKSNTGIINTIIGSFSGTNNSGNANTFIGSSTGQNNTGNNNTFIGVSAGQDNTSGYENTFLGLGAGNENKSGLRNTYIGTRAGYGSDSAPGGNNNVALGFDAGFQITTGENNTFLGHRSGTNNQTGSGNVFIGHQAGYLEEGSNKLYIDNSNTDKPLIYGDFVSNKVGINTNQLPNTIGTAFINNYSLYVKGGILTEEVRVRTGWADYVFNDNYELLPIDKVEAFITKNGHLPNVPSATQVENEGIEIGDITRIQQEKIEELTLYIIQLQKQLDAIEAKINE